MSVLEVADLHVGYATARVLHGVTLSVEEGQIVALLGRNGMGKTTLLRAVCGLRPPMVTEGSVRLFGTDVVSLPAHRVARRGIGFVPQGRRIFASLSVEENLRIAARRTADGWNLDRIYNLFPRLAERRGQMGGTLSGGEQQMLAIGRALMTNPSLLVMDEPSEGLAPKVRDAILERIRLLKQTGQSVLLAEQNVDLALDVADSVSVLGEAGTLQWSGAPARLRADEALLRQLIGL